MNIRGKLKRTALFTLTVIVFASVTAFADTVRFLNGGSSLVSDANRTTLTLTSSSLIGLSGLSGFGVPDNSATFPACRPNCLGTVSFNTSTVATGKLFSPSATFNQGGSIMVTGSGFTFSGQFAAGATWTCTPIPGAGCNTGTGTGYRAGTWFFNGTVIGGMLKINGQTYMISSAATVQLTTSGVVPGGYTNPTTGPLTWTDAGGTTTFAAPVPEPGSLGLVGSGLVVLGALAKQRASRKNASL